MTDWAEYFKKYDQERAALNAEKSTASEEPSFTLIETKQPLGTLTDTQRRIWEQAQLAGFELEGYSSTVHFYDVVQKNDGKKAQAGDITKAAHDFRNVFIGGHVFKLKLRFKLAWLESGFTAFVWDPVGRYMYANSRAEDERQTHWVIRGSNEFEQWLDEWREMLTGDSKRLEKARAEARKQERRDAIYQDYLDHQNGAGKYAPQQKEAA
ncbi:hypothetical protein [Streptomyces sp. AC495_CC817]|uniref:hypothetical protein n=1 Tax=Streptomyces sp. AC495_CC817 TaxID=2823900 RepID=UPI001C279710|nr:hypothetical protein [Streptomyces sp. AC495_CC817]